MSPGRRIASGHHAHDIRWARHPATFRLLGLVTTLLVCGAASCGPPRGPASGGSAPPPNEAGSAAGAQPSAGSMDAACASEPPTTGQPCENQGDNLDATSPDAVLDPPRASADVPHPDAGPPAPAGSAPSVAPGPAKKRRPLSAIEISNHCGFKGNLICCIGPKGDEPPPYSCYRP